MFGHATVLRSNRMPSVVALALLVVVAAGCGSPDRATIHSIEQLGGRVKLDESTARVIEVDFRDSKATDDDLALLAPLAALKTLNLSRTAVTGRGFDRLSGLDQLETLFLVESALDDAGLAHIQQLPGLRVLHFGRTKISDAGLAKLSGMPNLRTLAIGNTEITDAGLRSLKDIPQLSTVVATKTKTTAAGVQALRQALPKAQVER